MAGAIHPPLAASQSPLTPFPSPSQAPYPLFRPCGQNSLTPLLRLSPPRGARRGPLCENYVHSLCSAFPHATRFAGLARGPRSVLPKRLRPQARVVGQPPHERRHLGRRQTGRARSKRKERFGGSVRAERVPPCRRRGDGWHSLVVTWIKRDALGESFGPGRARIPSASLSAGAALAVDAGRRGRRPLRDGMRGRPVCLPGRRVLVTPVGADAHSRPPCQIPIYHQAKRKRMKKDRPFNNHPEVSAGPAHAGAERSECPSPARAGRRVTKNGGTDSEDPRFKQTCPHVQALRLHFFF